MKLSQKLSHKLVSFASHRSTLFLIVAGLNLSLISCDTTQPTDNVQYVNDIDWKPDASGMAAFIERTTVSAVIYNTPEVNAIFPVSNNGTIGNQIGTPEQWVAGYSRDLIMAPDGRSVVAQLGGNIYRVNLDGSGSRRVVDNAYLLTASPDLRYAVTTTTGPGNTTKTITIYDISSQPTRLVSKFNVFSATDAPGLWLENGQFALTQNDTLLTRFAVQIYDTLGHAQAAYSDASVPFHSAAFLPQTHDLFVRTLTGNINRINILSGLRTNVVPDANVESFDLSPDGQLLAYIPEDSTQARNLYVRNVQNGHKTLVGSDAVFVRVSPQGDKVAYSHITDDVTLNSEIRVAGVTLPQ